MLYSCWKGGDVAQLIEHRTGTPLTQVRFPSAAKDFSPRVNFQYGLSYGVRTSPCAIACINICAHVKDHTVYDKVQWIMETLNHPTCTGGWVARFCCSWLSPGKATRISKFPFGEIPVGQYNCLQKNLKRQSWHFEIAVTVVPFSSQANDQSSKRISTQEANCRRISRSNLGRWVVGWRAFGTRCFSSASQIKGEEEERGGRERERERGRGREREREKERERESERER